MKTMNLKEKFSMIILNFLKENKNKGFTVKEIGTFCFSRDWDKIEFYHNVTEFLRYLNDLGYVSFTYNDKVIKRRDIKEKVLGGTYKYVQGDGINSHEKILELWKKETIDFLLKNPRRSFKTTDIAREICGGDIEFITSQTIIMRELEQEKKVQFNHMGKPSFKGLSDLNGTWTSTRNYYVQTIR